jgi:mannose-6-phosphate isomerase-like protein (cupin superfamily)
MVKRTLEELKPYPAAGHFNMTAMRVAGKEETGNKKFWIGRSVFLPGGGAEWGYEDSPTEKSYYVLEGEMTVKSKTETFVVKAGECITILPFEGREMKNNANVACTLLVIIDYPQA